jgi:glucosamine--fructose-6-phosphate aminotransferase (isomerizing)
MCGIIGFTGTMDAKEVLTEGLLELEYRGYDSAGIAYVLENKIKTIKTAGKVSCLKEKV